MGEFRMPSLGATMETGTLVEWLKKPGDRLARGDIIAVVDTEKGAIEIEVYEDGVLGEILVEPGQQVPVGTVLAVIDGGTPTPAPQAPMPPSPRPKASPAARTAAAKLGVDLATLRGTGPDGAIQLADVEGAARPAPVAPVAPVAPLAPAISGFRRAIAQAMSKSKREIPHFYLAATIDLSRAVSWLASHNASRPVTERVLPVALLVRAVALALVDVPDLNGFWVDGGFQPGPGIHPGIAVSLRGGGLVTPALRDADRLPLERLMAGLADLVTRARSGGLRSSEVSGQTITLTNLGEQGVEIGYGIIYPPQVALVSFGRIVDRPVAVGQDVAVRPVVHVSVSVDHRAVDGHRAGLFLAALDRRLQSPEAL